MADKFRSGQRVTMPGTGDGTIIKTRHDDFGDAIYTVKLDDPTASADGIMYARDVELRAL